MFLDALGHSVDQPPPPAESGVAGWGSVSLVSAVCPHLPQDTPHQYHHEGLKVP